MGWFIFGERIEKGPVTSSFIYFRESLHCLPMIRPYRKLPGRISPRDSFFCGAGEFWVRRSGRGGVRGSLGLRLLTRRITFTRRLIINPHDEDPYCCLSTESGFSCCKRVVMAGNFSQNLLLLLQYVLPLQFRSVGFTRIFSTSSFEIG